MNRKTLFGTNETYVSPAVELVCEESSDVFAASNWNDGTIIDETIIGEY